MAEIGIEAVGINRYATESCNVVRMYTTNGSEELLSLGQLVSAVMLRSSAACEARAIYEVNMLNDNTSYQSMLAYVGKLICDSAETDANPKLSWKTSIAAQVKAFGYHAKSTQFAASGSLIDFLVYDCKISRTALPNAAENRELGPTNIQECIDAYAQVRPVMEAATRLSSLTGVEMQSAVSRRDVSFTTAANIVKVITGSSLYTASMLRN